MGSSGRRRIRISELIQWTDRQQEAWNATRKHRFVLYGGARGGGKSRWLRWFLLLYLIECHKLGIDGVRVGLFCETYKDLQDRQISKINIEFPTWLGQVKSTQEDGLGFFLVPELGGGMIALRNLDDPSKYQSSEFAVIAIDELTKTTRETFDILRGSLRWPGIGRTLFIAATNPGGIGHLWVKQLWVDRMFPPELESMKDEFCFVRALPSDNPHLDEQYWHDLNTLAPDLRRAWVEGDWNVFAGQAFGTWSSAHVIEPFELPTHWLRLRGLDWGYAKPMCCLWGAIDPDIGRLYVYRELYETKLTDRQQARMIKTMTPPHEIIRISYADPSLWTTKNVDDIVTTTADQYRAEGVLLTRADNHRLNGKRKVDRLLMNLPDGKPGLQVFSNCTNLIRTLPALPYDKTNVEDVDTDAEDHCLVSGTLVTTNVGDVEIQKVKVGDFVLTRDGYKSVVRSWMTASNAEVYQVDFSNGQSIIGTAGHPVYVVGKGFISIDALSYGDIILSRENILCHQKLLNSTELNLDGIQIPQIEPAECIIRQEEITEKEELDSCIRKFGRMFMGIFQRGIIYITKMVIHLIMTFPILSVFQRLIIYPNMRMITHPVMHTWQELDHLLSHGIDHKKEKSGIRNMRKNQSDCKLSHVISVVKNTKQKCVRRIIIVHQLVKQRQEEKAKLILLQKCAQYVVKSLNLISTIGQKRVPDCVVRVCDVRKLNNKQDVYNLEIMDKHEFFANGVLVHNCYDALRYLATGIRDPKPQQNELSRPHPLVGVRGL